jgi:hypothetical protein
MFNRTKNFIKTVSGKILTVDEIVERSVSVTKTKLGTLKETAPTDMKTMTLAKEVLQNLEYKNVDNKIITVYAGIKVRAKHRFETLTHYGYSIAGDVLTELGESTVDDDVIIAVVTTACVAAVSSMSGPIGGLLANVVTANTLKPILKGAFKLINQIEIKVGKNLKEKSKENK